jgi:GntR family transcriptional regulator
MRGPRDVDPTADRPVYKQVADALRTDITTGEYRPGRMLPSETHLCQEFGVGLNTIRSALAVLRGEGLVVTEPGRGTRVRQAGERTVTHVPGDAEISARMPTEAERREMGLPEGVPVLVVHREGEDDEVLPADRHVVRYDGG